MLKKGFDNFSPRLVKFIAPLLNKPEERFNWILETDKQMSKVCTFDVAHQWMSPLSIAGRTRQCRQTICLVKIGSHLQLWGSCKGQVPYTSSLHLYEGWVEVGKGKNFKSETERNAFSRNGLSSISTSLRLLMWQLWAKLLQNNDMN